MQIKYSWEHTWIFLHAFICWCVLYTGDLICCIFICMHTAYTQNTHIQYSILPHTDAMQTKWHTLIHAYTLKCMYLYVLFSSCGQGDCWMLLLFRLQYWFLRVTKLWGAALSAPCVLYSTPSRYTCFKSTGLLLCCASVWLNAVVREQGTLPEPTCPLNPRTARLAPITVPQCIISKWTDLYIKYKQQLIQVKSP